MPPTKAATAPFQFICQSCRHRTRPQFYRSFTTTPIRRADDPPPASSRPPTDGATSALSKFSQTLTSHTTPNSQNTSAKSYTDLMNRTDSASLLDESYARRNQADEPPHRLHIYAHKHNTHITFVQPPRLATETTGARNVASGAKASLKDQKKMIDVLIALSTGNIGFKKAARGSYDAAFQLIAFVLKQIQERGILRDISKMEVTLRGFGAGREAVTKALLGTEGRHIRGKIVSVVDATRLKQGGPRAPKPRRLG